MENPHSSLKTAFIFQIHFAVKLFEMQPFSAVSSTNKNPSVPMNLEILKINISNHIKTKPSEYQWGVCVLKPSDNLSSGTCSSCGLHSDWGQVGLRATLTLNLIGPSSGCHQRSRKRKAAQKRTFKITVIPKVQSSVRQRNLKYHSFCVCFGVK